MEKILITGGKGFFATRFTNYYKDKYDILGIDKDQIDITNENQIIQFIKEYKPDYVIHAAAIAVTDYCNKNPKTAYNVNVNGAVNVAKGCLEANSKLVFLSSEQVFNGNTSGAPFKEQDKAIPNTVYGDNKLEAEGILKEMLEKLYIVRFTWLFGVPEKNMPVNPNILWDAVISAISSTKQKLPTHEFRGMAYVNDVIENFTKIFSLPYDTYHVGAENNLSRYETASFVLQQMGIENRIDSLLEMDNEKYKETPRDVRISTNKIKNKGIEFLNTEEGIIKCISDYSLKMKP